MKMENYYSVLGVSPSASEEEIKRAYRKLSVKMHPDKNEGDDFFEEFFKKINEAYYVLGNIQRRREYDALFGAEKVVKEPVKKAENVNVNRKNEFVVDYSYVWREVKIWRRVKNFLLVLNVCILVIVLLPRIGFEMPFENSENVIMYGKTNTENSLNLRIHPSLDAEILTKIPSKVRVEILEEGKSYMEIGGEYGNWLKIRYGENVGWVWGGYVDKLEGVEYTDETTKSESINKAKSVENVFVLQNDYSQGKESVLDANSSCYDEFETEMINDGMKNFVPVGKGIEKKYRGKNVTFVFREFKNNVGGELVLDGVKYLVNGIYEGEGMYFGAIWKDSQNFGVVTWSYGKCMSISYKNECEESEIELCTSNTNPFFGGVEDNKNATGRGL